MNSGCSKCDCKRVWILSVLLFSLFRSRLRSECRTAVRIADQACTLLIVLMVKTWTKGDAFGRSHVVWPSTAAALCYLQAGPIQTRVCERHRGGTSLWDDLDGKVDGGCTGKHSDNMLSTARLHRPQWCIPMFENDRLDCVQRLFAN